VIRRSYIGLVKRGAAAPGGQIGSSRGTFGVVWGIDILSTMLE
jgi:hypothetical protein